MARGGWSRQPRDRRGRWTSYGSGAAMQTGGRGARLMSPGKQRDGGGKKVKGPKGGMPSGTISKTKRSKPAAKPQSSAAGQIRGNYRPENLFSRTDTKHNRGYGIDAKANIAEARRRVEATGATSKLKSNKRSPSVGGVDARKPNEVQFNASHSAWNNPKAEMRQSRRKNEFSTSSAQHYAQHELGHVKNPTGKMAGSWDAQLRGKGQIYADADKVLDAKRLARRVSKYAMQTPAEFTAEVSAGLSLGKKYDKNVMAMYRNIQGKSQGRTVRGSSRVQRRRNRK
jgi:hypothetical protein